MSRQGRSSVLSTATEPEITRTRSAAMPSKSRVVGASMVQRVISGIPFSWASENLRGPGTRDGTAGRPGRRGLGETLDIRYVAFPRSQDVSRIANRGRSPRPSACARRSMRHRAGPDPHDATSPVLRAGRRAPGGRLWGRGGYGPGGPWPWVGIRGLGQRWVGWLWIGVVALLLVLVVGLVVVKAREPGRQLVHRRLRLWVQVDEFEEPLRQPTQGDLVFRAPVLEFLDAAVGEVQLTHPSLGPVPVR